MDQTGPRGNVGQRAVELARVAALLAEEASHLALLHGGEGHDADVARRAAQQAREAASLLGDLRADDDPAAALHAATWALSAAAIALTQAKASSRRLAPPAR